MVVTGGLSSSPIISKVFNEVTEYNETGLVQELPRLQQARSHHACGDTGEVNTVMKEQLNEQSCFSSWLWRADT